jgi:DNA polymerase IV (DinB-like DNA polymerase)
MPKQRIILHLDMDYFYAAVEERENPKLKGKPVVVGADPKAGKGRGVVSTCNYEARKYHIHSGTPISKAYKLCPDCVFLPVNMPLYVKVSEKIIGMLRKYSEKSEKVSIDEIYLDLSKKAKDFKEAEEIAKKIKKEIMKKENLTCSIGIGPNKLIAKIASDFEKPDGLTVVKPEKVLNFIYPMDVRKLQGVGPKTEQALEKMGIKTIKQLSATKQDKLIEKFGSFGHDLHLMSKGKDEREVEESYEIKSIGRQITFQEDTKDEKLISITLDSLAEEVHAEVKQNKLFFKTVTVVARFGDFDTHTSAKSMPVATDSISKIKDTAKDLMKKYIKDRRKIRLIGVRVSKFSEKEAQKQLV